MTLRDSLTSRDFHVHSALSNCGRKEMTLENILVRAREIGVRVIGISDHIHREEDVDRILPLKREIETRRVEGLKDVYFGCELDLVAPGRTSAPIRQLGEYEFVNVAINHFHLDWVQNLPDAPAKRATYWLRLMESAVELPRCDTIVHPFAPLGETADKTALFYQVPRERLVAVFERMAERGIGLEFPHLPVPDAPKEMRAFYSMALESGVLLAANTDSHTLDRMGCQAEWLTLAQDLRLREEHFWRLEPRYT
jgi:histidinol phosphatase-like PHP family hydrolase